MPKKSLTEKDIVDGKITEGFLDDIYELDLSNCDWLIPTPQLIDQLKPFEEQKDILGEFYKLHWPKHFGRNDEITAIKLKFIEMISEHNKATGNTAGAPNLYILISRYLDEFSKHFEAPSKQITNNILWLLNAVEKFIKQNPNNLRNIEDMAEMHTYECLSIPVFGVIKMVAWLSLAQYPIDAARQLMVMDEVVKFLHVNAEKSSEFEARNVLLRNFCKKFIENKTLKKPWVGIMDLVPNEGVLITEQMKNFEKEVEPNVEAVFKKTPDEIAAFLYENEESDLWARIAFPKEVIEIEGKYSAHQEAVSELFGKLNLHNEKKDSELSYKEFQNFIEIIKNKLPQIFENIQRFVPQDWLENSNNNKVIDKQEGYEILSRIRTVLGAAQQAEIYSKSKDLTQSHVLSNFQTNDQPKDGRPASGCFRRLSQMFGCVALNSDAKDTKRVSNEMAPGL